VVPFGIAIPFNAGWEIKGYRIGCREKPIARMTALLAATTFAVKPKNTG
jgi:hypothetical protein